MSHVLNPPRLYCEQITCLAAPLHENLEFHSKNKPERGSMQPIAKTLTYFFSVLRVSYSLDPQRFTLGNGTESSEVQLETFVDLLCPDSRKAFPALKELTKVYDPAQLSINIVLFPLPYHQHSFASAEATYTITSDLGSDVFPEWIELMYDSQDRFTNRKTMNMSAVQVIKDLKVLAKSKFPKLSDDQWDEKMTGFGGTTSDFVARVSWKYACSKGINGTPQYFINDEKIPATPDRTVDDWRKIIDSILKKQVPPSALAPPDRAVRASGTNADTCNDTQYACNFLSGKTMCCAQKEKCIPQIGCK